MSSIFSRIVSGEIPCYKIAETNEHLAFLDVFPLVKGHVLVIPKREIDYLFDMDNDAYLELFQFARQVAKAIEKVIPCKKIGVAVIGLEVAHAHIHLVPINSVGDINFTQKKLTPTKEELESVAQQIKTAFSI